MSELPEITVQMLKDAGLKCYQLDFAGAIGSKLYEKGYTFDQIREAFFKFAYHSEDSGAPLVRLRPSLDPDAMVCPDCGDPEIVMQPIVGADNAVLWRCPKCKFEAITTQ
jgi:hypothetical protein